MPNSTDAFPTIASLIVALGEEVQRNPDAPLIVKMHDGTDAAITITPDDTAHRAIVITPARPAQLPPHQPN